MKTRLVFYIILIVFFSSCKITNNKGSQTTVAVAPDTLQPQLIFLTFQITKDSANNKSVVNLAKVQLTEGQLKKQSIDDYYPPSLKNYLRCIILNEKNDTLKRVTIDHPLFKTYEYTNTDNSFGSKEVTLKASTFTLRLDYNSGMKYLFIIEKLEGNSEAEIAKIELSF